MYKHGKKGVGTGFVCVFLGNYKKTLFIFLNVIPKTNCVFV